MSDRKSEPGMLEEEAPRERLERMGIRVSTPPEEVMIQLVIYDEEDGTFHAGDGDWTKKARDSEIYTSKAEAQSMLEELDNDHILGERLRIRNFDDVATINDDAFEQER